MVSEQIRKTTGRPWVKPIGRAFLAILIGIYGQLALALLIWYMLGSTDQLSALAELGIKVATIAIECSVLLFIALDKEPLKKYINLNLPRRIFTAGVLCAIPLVAANRVMQGWIIRFVHGEFAYYQRLTSSDFWAIIFLFLQIAYYFLEVFILVYAYAKLADGLRAWRPLPHWTVITIGWFFLFTTWSLAHGFVVTDVLTFGIGLYLPLVFAALYEYTKSQLTPAITWLLFLAI
jgi:hypothetical protein